MDMPSAPVGERTTRRAPTPPQSGTSSQTFVASSVMTNDEILRSHTSGRAPYGDRAALAGQRKLIEQALGFERGADGVCRFFSRRARKRHAWCVVRSICAAVCPTPII